MTQMIHLLQEDFITVGAVFEDEVTIEQLLKEKDFPTAHQFAYTFKANADMGLKAGDLALVHAQNEIKIVRIVEIHDSPLIDETANFDYKWVIQKVDITAFQQRMAEEKLLKRLLGKLVAVEKKHGLTERLEKAKELDADLKALVEQFKQLKGY